MGRIAIFQPMERGDPATRIPPTINSFELQPDADVCRVEQEATDHFSDEHKEKGAQYQVAEYTLATGNRGRLVDE